MPEESKFTKDYVKQAIANGTINPRTITKFFYDIKLKSYDYGHLIQRELVNLVNEYYPDSQDVIDYSFIEHDLFENNDRDRVAYYTVHSSFIHPTKRREYKRSTFFNKYITYDDIINNKNIFKYNPILFINKKIQPEIKIKAREDKTRIFIKYDYFNDPIVQPATTANALFLSKSILDIVDLADGDIVDGKIACSKFTNGDKFKFYHQYIGYFSAQDKNIFISDITYDEATDSLNFNNSTVPANYAGVKLIIVALGNFLKKLNFTSTDKFFDITDTIMPVPKDNFLVFIQDTDGINYYPNDGSITFTEYYPNIYEINNGSGRPFIIYALYDDNTTDGNIAYDNEIKFYTDRIDLLAEYKDGTVKDVLKEYKPVTWDYLLRDFHEKYDEEWFTEDNFNAFRYKLEKVEAIYRKWCLFFETYVRRTYGFLPGYLMDMSKTNVTLKERIDTTLEIDAATSMIYKRFDTKQVVFIYKNDNYPGVETSYIFYIDGFMTVPTYAVHDSGYYFVYFPRSKVKDNSIIEVERFDGITFELQADLSAGTPIEISMEDNTANILANALYLIDEDTGNYLNTNRDNLDVQMTVIDDKIGEFDINETESTYIISPKMKIRLTPVNYTGVARLCCNNRLVIYHKDLSGISGNTNLNDKYQIVNIKNNFISRFRMWYKDGRMFSRNAIEDFVSQPETSYEPPLVTFKSMGTVSDIYIGYVGYDERLVYREDYIDTTDVIKLIGKLERPFSFTYYNVYLNGVRLNKTNVVQVSPFIIYLKNIKSNNDFEIYEKVRAEDSVYEFDASDGNTESSDYIADKIYDEDEEYQDKVKEEIPEVTIDPNLPDLDDLIASGAFIQFILDNYLNGDEMYPGLDVVSEMFDPTNNRYLMNADHRITNKLPDNQIYYLSHDKTIEAGIEYTGD